MWIQIKKKKNPHLADLNLFSWTVLSCYSNNIGLGLIQLKETAGPWWSFALCGAILVFN